MTDLDLARLASDFRPDDPSWPLGLAGLEPPVPRLRIAGRLPSLERAVAVVGTRRASPAGLALARSIAAELGALGWVVVSGGAEGIDAAAHEGALAGGGETVAVLAGGLGCPYPRAHAPLFARIAERGALVSECDDLATPRPARCLSRNRIIAALAAATLVVQAPARSGALSTAAHARRLVRPVLALPWSVGDPSGEGSNALLAARRAWVVRDAADVIEAITGGRPSLRRAPRAARPRVGSDARALLACLGSGGAHADVLATRAGMPIGRALAALTELSLAGLAAADVHGAWHRAQVSSRGEGGLV